MGGLVGHCSLDQLPQELHKSHILPQEATKHDPERLLPGHRDLQEMAEVKGWFQSGHGNLSACLEEFTLCSDGNYHRIDHLGHIFNITVVPYQVMLHPVPAVVSNTGEALPEVAEVHALHLAREWLLQVQACCMESERSQ